MTSKTHNAPSAATGNQPNTVATAGPASAAAMASQAKAGRNRAVDLYRVLAMLAVAVGHWMVIVVYRDDDGQLVSGNALEFIPDFRPATWIFQVMPLFFMVGGYASAASLDSKGIGIRSTANERGTWIAGRLARLLPPVAALAAAWLVALGVGAATGQLALVNAGAVAAAIPLWFLANYVADVILAPHVLPLFRRTPTATAAGGLALFAALEVIRFTDPFAGIPLLNGVHHLNWILGWFLFQVLGFAWRDGLLPTGRQLLVATATVASAAVLVVAVGPWPVSMVHFPGLAVSPTHPPSLALLLFGATQSAIAVASAPTVTRFLERNKTAWTGVVAANSVAMTVYLWHMTAAVIVLALFDQLNFLGPAATGSASWWLAKVPFVVASTITMAVIVPRLAVIERRALLTKRGSLSVTPATLMVAAVVASVALKGWTSGNIALIVPSLIVVLAITRAVSQVLPNTKQAAPALGPQAHTGIDMPGQA